MTSHDHDRVGQFDEESDDTISLKRNHGVAKSRAELAVAAAAGAWRFGRERKGRGLSVVGI